MISQTICDTLLVSRVKKSHLSLHYRRDLYENGEHHATTGGATCLRQARHHLAEISVVNATKPEVKQLETAAAVTLNFRAFVSFTVKFVTTLLSQLCHKFLYCSPLCN